MTDDLPTADMTVRDWCHHNDMFRELSKEYLSDAGALYQFGQKRDAYIKMRLAMLYERCAKFGEHVCRIQEETIGHGRD